MARTGRSGIRFGVFISVALAIGLGFAADSSRWQTINMGQLVGYRGVIVPPVERTDTADLVDCGTFDADGYSTLVVNLAGEMKDRPAKTGVIGALLIPDVPPFNKAYSNLLLLPVPLEIAAPVTVQGFPYFMAKQSRFEVGFPRYRLLLYNSTGSSATVTITVYRAR